MSSQIKVLNGTSGSNENLKRKANAVTSTTTSRTSSKASGGKAKNMRSGPTTQNKAHIPMGTTLHKAGTVPEYLRNR